MSTDNFDDAMHIVKKINYFLGMCLQDVDHLNYKDNEKQMLRTLMNIHGNLFLNNLVEAVVVTDNLSKIKYSKDMNITLSDEDANKIQEEWDKVFNNVGKKKLKTRDLFSEGQTSKEDAKESERDPSDSSEK